jgi:hypothetical protein
MHSLRMRSRLAWAVLVFASGSTLILEALPAQTQRTAPIHVFKSDDWTGQAKYREGQLLVRFRPSTPSWAAQAAHADVGAQITRSWPSVEGLQLVRLPAGVSLKQAIRTYRHNPAVLYAEPNYVVHLLGSPNDPMFSQMWGLQNTGQNGGVAGADIHAAQAWNVTTGSSSVVVALLDTGIDYNHQDLAANVWSNPAAFSQTIDGATITCSVGTHGFNTISGACDPLDDNGHGSHTSGTIGAVGNNAVGVTGVNWSVQLMACKFLDETGSGDLADAITCLDFVKAMKDRGANIVATNNSWGSNQFSQALADAIQAQMQDGILFVAAAGNDFTDNDIVPVYPANYLLPNVISVAATTRFDQVADFSDVGLHSVYLGAPGQEILSTTPNNTYSVLSGTSMATPHVTGTAALLAAQNSNHDWRAIKNLILAGGDTISALAQTITGKRLDAYGSLTCANSTMLKRLQPTLDTIPGTIGQPVTIAALNINCAQPAGTVQVTVTPGNQILTLLDNGTEADQAAGDGIYTGQFTPPDLGNYSLALPNGDTVQVTVLSNYTAAETSYSYQTITGTSLNVGDDDVATITSPFPVQFGGGSFTNLYVSSNGTISFTNAFDDYTNWYLPLNYLAEINTQNGPPPLLELPVTTLVAPLWQDLYPIKGTNQNVFWQTVGTAPNRQLVVEWRNVGTYECRTNSSANVTFEVVFSEGNSNFSFNYANAAFGGACSDQDYGAAASVGMQITQNVGSQWSLDQQSVGSGMSLLWSVAPSSRPQNPVPTISSISPSSIAAGSGNTTATITGTGFTPTSQVTVYPVTSLVTTYVSNTQIKVLFTAADLFYPTFGSPLQINVTNPQPGGGSSQPEYVTITSPSPQITSISPSSVPAGSFGFLLTINGSGFFPSSDVIWNGNGGQTNFVSANQIAFAVPGSMVQNAGTVQLQVENPVSSLSNTVSFTITPASTPGAIIAPSPTSSGAPANPDLPGPTKVSPVLLPARFPGWRYAQARGKDYLSQFLRNRAGLAAPLPKPLVNAASTPNPQLQLSPQSSGAPLPGFSFRPTLPADFLPTAVVTADFNHDGHMDWAVANGGSNNIWIYLGKGDGTAQIPTIIPLTGTAPVSLAAVDMNHDGKLDLVVAEADSGSVGVLLGNGDGTFAPEREFYVPGAAESLAVADFDGDGNPDVVVGIFGDDLSGSLAFLRGDGTGNLGQPFTHFGQTNGLYYTTTLAAADLNGDGLPDLVAVDYSVDIDGLSLQNQFPRSGARVYLNAGNGNFKAAQQFYLDATSQQAGDLGKAATAVALGDVNHDGCVDAVVTDTEGVATVFPGKCDGTFDTSNVRIFATGIVAAAAALADLNADGKLDLVSSAFPFQDDPSAPTSMGTSVSVQFGDGTGNFGSAVIYRGEPGMYGIAIADLNGDGHPDIVTANQGSDSVSVYINDGHGGFGGATGGYLGYLAGGLMHAVVNAPFTNFAYSDVNGDGHKDLVVLEIGAQYPLPSEITVLPGDGAGHFAAPIRSPILDVNQMPLDFALADFRNVGLPDLLMINNGLSYSRNNGDGTFQKPVTTTLTDLYPIQIVVADFNHDGKLDIVLVNFSSSPTGNGDIASLVPFLGNGDGTFTQGTPFSVSSTGINGPIINAAFAADVNHDGKLDLLVSGNSLIGAEQNAFYELLGNGDGTFQTPKLLFSNPGNSSYFAVADLNKDGLPDVVEEAISNQVVNNSLARTYQIHLGQADGTFKPGASYGPFQGSFAQALIFGAPDKPSKPLQPTMADINGDGNLDIVVFESIVGGSIDSSGVISGAGTTTELQVLAGNGDGTFSLSNIGYSLGSLAAPQLAVDVSGDGLADLVELDGYSSSFDVVTASPGPSFAVALVTDPVVGSSGKLRVMLANPSAAATTVQLTTSDPNITVPATVSIPAGSVIQDVSIAIGAAFNPLHVFSIRAQLATESHTVYGTQAATSAGVGFAAILLNPPPSTPVIAESQSVNYSFLVASLGGYATQLQASCPGLPAGASCQFDSNPIQLPAGQVLTANVTITTVASTPLGSYSPNVVLTDGQITQQIPIAFNVGDFTMGITPASQTVGASDFTAYTLALGGVNGYGSAIQLACSGLPTGVICPVSGQSVIPSQQGDYFQIHTQNTPTGTYTFTITGVSGPLTHTASAQLIVSNGTFSGTILPTAATIPVGSSQSFSVSLNSQSGFNGNVNLSCGTPPNGIACQFNPVQVSLATNGSGGASLQITVSAKPAAVFTRGPQTRRIWHQSAFFPGLAMLILLLMVIIGSEIRRDGALRHSKLGLALVICALVFLACLSACGGGGTGGGGGGGGGNSITVQVPVQASAGGTTVTLGSLSITVP